ncbi:MAG: Gfo/Idh/MocA family oxidoreductase, partial [Mycetocola sp.]
MAVLSRPLSVAILGFWHVHAAGYAIDILNSGSARLRAAWEPDPVLAQEGLSGIDGGGAGIALESELDSVLGRDDVDAVIVTTATAQHRDVILAAIRAGKHVFTEKLLAPTVVECEELVDAARRHRVTLFVSLPRLGESATIAARRLVDDGALGHLTYSRVRMAHDGWITGWLPDRFADRNDAVGGALTDVGCHPVYLTQLFLGARPTRLTATYTHVTGRTVEDNAVVTASYPDGAVGVIEASFVTTPGASTLELRGTEGSLLYGLGTEQLLARGPHFESESWLEVPLPEPRPTPVDEWIGHIRAGTFA